MPWAALRFWPLGPAGLLALGGASVAAALGLAWLFEVGIDRPVLALNRRIADRWSRVQR